MEKEIIRSESKKGGQGKSIPGLLSGQTAILFGSYLVVAFVLRFFTLFPSVINHDESTYIIIAHELLQGGTYWVDIIDTKPVGIYLLFAVFQAVFGYNIISIRVIAIIWVALTALFLDRAHRKIGGDSRAALASGFFFILMTSLFIFFGLSPNTELFFILFTIISLNILLINPGAPAIIVAGLLLGAGFVIKPVVLFDFIAFAFLFLLLYRWNWKQFLYRSVLFGLAFVVPIVIVAWYFYKIGEADNFLHFTFNVSGDYLVRKDPFIYLTLLADFFSRFFFVSIPFFICLFSPRIISWKIRLFIIIWSVLIWVGILLPGNLYYHYTIQFMVPFALLAGSIFDKRRSPGRFFQIVTKKKVGIPILVVFVSVVLFFHKRDIFDKPDTPRKVASYLNKSMSRSDEIFTGDAHQIIYHLTQKSSPLPYIHRSLFWKPEFENTLSAPFDQLFDSIQKDPAITFILQEKREGFIPSDSLFVLDTMIDNITIYRRR